MNSLSIYGGEVSAGAQDGDLITEQRKIALVGIRDADTGIKTYALRTMGADKPACIIKAILEGENADWFEVSADMANWDSFFTATYVRDANVLFFIRCNIPEDADYGDNSNNYLVFDYMGGV